ncbi:FkbM family methyltransferase [Candidatus Gracilibacteria bacterium]|nr:FkbM family methyltransferase [Candidatus Gracilibacteria bacterium]MCF7898670.1 FkbM family methyltransferase [Candidatus Paceibacterota bacterium]
MNNNIFSYKEISFSGNVFGPGELIQIDTEKNLDSLIGINREDIKNIIVVGAWRGNEVDSFLRYPNATIYCFEPNKENYNHLSDRWGSNKRVLCFEQACASFDGEAVLHEANLTGNDSLLPIIENSKHNLKLINTHKIKTVKLDGVKELKDKEIDLLWADTQGYEIEVLSGATELLKRTKSLFLEVYRQNVDYQGGAKYSKVIEFLNRKGFRVASEGLENNMGGNAFFIENNINSDAYNLEKYEQRIKDSLKEVSRKKRLLNFKFIRLLTVYTPVKIKTFIRKCMFNISNH